MKKLVHYLKVYASLSKGFKKILWQVAWYSLWVELDLKFNNSKYFKCFQENQTESPLTTLFQKRQVVWVQKSIAILAHHAPWKPMCLNRAITAKYLLKKQGIETTFYIGFKARTSEEESFKGHAWLTVNGFFITGLIPELLQYKQLTPLQNK